MKYGIYARVHPHTSNHFRTNSINNLQRRHLNSLHNHSKNYTRQRNRLSNPNNTHKWSLPIFYPPIYPHSTRYLLRLTIKSNKSLTIRYSHPSGSNSNSISRICPPMRTNIILRSDSNHRHPVSNPSNR